MARLLVDEDLPRSLKKALENAGHHAEDVRDVGLRTRPDAEIFAYAIKHALSIVTADVGFGNIKTYALGSHAGILLARYPSRTPIATLNAAIVGALRLLPDDDLIGNLIVINAGRLRIRRKP